MKKEKKPRWISDSSPSSFNTGGAGMPIETKLFIVIALIATFALGLVTASYLQPSSIPSVILRQLPLAEKFESSINIVAARAQGEVGVVSQATAEIIEGKGRVLFSLNPFVEPDTQQSAETAAAVAENFTGKSLADRDVIYGIENIDAQLVGGPSAGAALAVATIAALEGKKVREDAAITGTIQADGSIGQIGGVIEKAAASAETGLKLFIVPKGQIELTYYEQLVQEEKRGFVTIRRVRYIPKTLNLNDYAQEQGWNLEVKEVSNIQEAVNLLIA
ncbi:MAG: S16 family serine protease [Candidatus Diapherotrites archaeon]|nr:S16 family serine protease [Candidatus Diapherotrites archaeon]